MKKISTLIGILSKRKYLAIFIILITVFLPLLAINAAIISPVSFTFNPLAEPLGIALTIAIAILIGFNLTVLLYNHEIHSQTKNKTTLIGGVAALFTTACPLCLPTWIVWLGFGSVAGFLSGISIYITIASIVILLLSLYNLLKCASGACDVGKNEKNS